MSSSIRASFAPSASPPPPPADAAAAGLFWASAAGSFSTACSSVRSSSSIRASARASDGAAEEDETESGCTTVSCDGSAELGAEASGGGGVAPLREHAPGFFFIDISNL